MKTPEQGRSEQPAESTPASAPGAPPQARSEALEAELAALEAMLPPPKTVPPEPGRDVAAGDGSASGC